MLKLPSSKPTLLHSCVLLMMYRCFHSYCSTSHIYLSLTISEALEVAETIAWETERTHTSSLNPLFGTFLLLRMKHSYTILSFLQGFWGCCRGFGSWGCWGLGWGWNCWVWVQHFLNQAFQWRTVTDLPHSFYLSSKPFEAEAKTAELEVIESFVWNTVTVLP